MSSSSFVYGNSGMPRVLKISTPPCELTTQADNSFSQDLFLCLLRCVREADRLAVSSMKDASSSSSLSLSASMLGVKGGYAILDSSYNCL